MGFKKKHLVCVGLFVAVALLLLANPLRMTAVGEEAVINTVEELS